MKRLRGVKYMTKGFEYITTLFSSLSETNTITGFVVFSDVNRRTSGEGLVFDIADNSPTQKKVDMKFQVRH
jgi:hypothetical protein